ncbi:unnamed protein product [Arctia plantaginis]|uniref:Uncharacterized protein n=1 Tax=Arctia plantaginis TaxID=874455 RepID=A0A8S0Z9L1_ARCPL|nr:unnamed protein product [Arctia plantaginis]
MILVILTAVLAVSQAANIEKRYISLFNTRKSGGLFSPLGSIGIESPAVPSGGYTNDNLGVVVDAVAPGTRTSGVEPTGLGGPRTSYGSLDSKVGDAAFEVGGISSSGSVEEYEHDKIHAQKFAHNVGLSTKGGASEIASAFGSSKQVETELPSFGLGSIGSKDEDASIADASLKVSAAGVDSLFGSGIGQKENVELPGIGVLPKVSSSVVGVEGYKNDKSHEQKFELEGGIATHPHVETLTSQKQNAKEESVSHVLDGSYNVQNNNDKSDNAKCNGEEKTNLSINSGDSILKPNLVGQGSTVVQGSIGNGQSISTAGQSIENKFDGFGLNGQTETLNTPEFLYDVGKIGVTGGFQTAGSYGVNQEKTQHFGIHAEKHGESNVVNHQSSVSTSASTSSVGTPNPGQQVPGSTQCTNAFNTGNFNQAGQNSEDSKFGSYFLTSPFYPGYTVVDNRQKLSGYEGVKFSTNSSPLKAAPLVNFQGLHFPIKNSLNLDLNKPIISPQYRQHQGLTSSHYKVLTQTYVPSFTSAFLKPSTNFAQLSSNKGSFSSNGDQDSLSHKSTFLSDQKLLVHNQSNQKSSEFSVIPTQFGSMSGSKFLEKPLTIGIPTTPAAFEKMPEAKSISNIVSGSQNNQFGFPFSSINNAKHNGSYQDTLLGLVTGSQGLSGQKHTGSGSQQPHLSFSLRDLLNYKPQSTFSKSFSQSYTSQGNTANKPFDSIPTPLHRHSGVGIGQNHESAASTSASSGSFRNTKTKYQTTNIGTNGLQPFVGSLTQTVNKQTKVFKLTPSTDLLSVAHSIFDQSVSKVANTVPGAEIPISVTEKSSELASFIGKGETFGGPRDPPSFDIKAGYHY